MSIVLILSWYLGGACAAAWMFRRGHSAAPWCVGGALLGALLWVIALPVSRISDRAVRWTTADPARRSGGRLIVGLADEPGDVAGTVQSVARADDHLLVLHRLGLEATSSLVETGELAEAERRTAAVGQRWQGPVETRIGTGPPDAVLEGALDRRRPSLLVRGPVTGWGWRAALRRSVALGASLGCPVLHAPAGAGDRALTTPMARLERRS